MRLNIFAEHMPSQELQMVDVIDLLNETLKGMDVPGRKIHLPINPEDEPMALVQGLMRQEKELSKEKVAGVVSWIGTLPTLYGYTVDPSVSTAYAIDQAMEDVRLYSELMGRMGMLPPGIILLASRPMKKTYDDTIKAINPDVSRDDMNRWWDHGYPITRELVSNANYWCRPSPTVITIDPRKPYEAVDSVMQQIPSSVWTRYQSTEGGPQLTEKERFLGMEIVNAKISKKILQPIRNEAEQQQVPLDYYIQKILRKHLLEGVTPSLKGVTHETSQSEGG